MGTALLLLLQHHQSLLRPASSFSYVTSSGITTSDVSNPRIIYLLPPHQNVLRQQSMKNLTVITAATTHLQPRLFCAINSGNSNNSGIQDSMADNSQSVSGTSTILNGEKEEEKKELEKSTPRYIPPPPEKPLPDDCCGSGCVRCVWDIYYEELEAYNKLYKTSPDSPNASSEQS